MLDYESAYNTQEIVYNPRTMNAIIKSQFLREVLLFTGLLGAALLISALFAEPSLAGGLIDPSDNPSLISGATDGDGDLKSLVQTMLNFFLGFLGFIATVMVIYGGGLYVTSQGKDEQVGTAKKVLLYAIIGIIIILLSFAIINTVLGSASSGSLGV